MRIANSSVSMASYHEKETLVSVRKASAETRVGAGAALSGGAALESAAAVYERSGASFGAWQMSGGMGLSRPYAADFGAGDLYDLHVSLLDRLLEALSGKG